MDAPETEHELSLLSTDGTLVTAILQTKGQGFGDTPEDGLFSLELRFSSRALRASSPDDFFSALSTLRALLESEGLLLCCYGCSRNVYPSAMDLGSSSDKAYRTFPGRPSLQSDRVSLFASGPDVEPVTIADQRTYHDQWIASLRARS
jgi:hypothetical protein